MSLWLGLEKLEGSLSSEITIMGRRRLAPRTMTRR